jgi:hypothetical protein
MARHLRVLDGGKARLGTEVKKQRITKIKKLARHLVVLEGGTARLGTEVKKKKYIKIKKLARHRARRRDSAHRS